MKTLAALSQVEIVTLLRSYSFNGLHLKTNKDNTTTYTFSDVDLRKLKMFLGQPTLAGDGKVAVFQIPNVGRLGVSFANRLVRVVDETKASKTVDKSHLGGLTLPDDLGLYHLKAQANPSVRVKYMGLLFDHFNRLFFHHRMPMPSLSAGTAPPSTMRGLDPQRTRGAYQGGPHYSAGKLWMNAKTFIAPTEVFLEVFVHECCHMAVHCIDKVRDNSEEGHGPNWQAWMVKCGLNPSRFDLTDRSAYETNQETEARELELIKKYGKRSPQAEIDKLVKDPLGDKAVIHGRIFTDLYVQGSHVEGKAPNGKHFGFKYASAKAAEADRRS